MWRRAILALLLLAVLALPAWFAYRTLYTEPGLAFVLEQLRRIPGVTLEAEGTSGTLAGPLTIERLVVDHEAVHIEARRLALEPRFRQLLNQTLTLRDVSIGALTIRLKSRQPPPQKELHFLPRLLRIAVRDLAAHDVTLTLQNGASYHFDLVSGSALVTRWVIDLPGVAIEDGRGRIDGALRLRAAEPLRLSGRFAGRWRLPDGHEYRFTLVARGDQERLGTSFALTQPAVLSFEGTALNLGASARLVGTVRASDFDGSPWLPAGSLPKVGGSVAVDAGLHSFGLDGTLTAAEFGGEPLRLQGSGRIDGRRLDIEGLRAWLPQSGLTLRTRGSVHFDGGKPLLGLEGDFQRLRWPLTGATVIEAPQGEYRIDGDLPYRVRLDAVARGPQIPQASFTAAGVVDADGLKLDAVEAQTLGGRLRGGGTLTWQGTQSWKFRVEGSGIDVGLLRPDLPGRIDVLGTLEGSGFAADAPWSARIERMSGTLLGRALAARGEVRHRDGSYELLGVRLDNAGTRIDLRGRVGKTMDLDWDADVRALQLLLPGLRGSLRSRGTLRGTAAAPLLVAQGEARELVYGSVRVAAVDFDVDADLGNSRESRVELAAQDLKLGGLQFDEATLTGRGLARDHRLDLRLDSPGDPARQLVPFKLRLGLEGAYAHADTSWRGTLADALLDYDTGDARLIQPAALALSPSAIEVAPTCFATGESQLCAEGDWQASPQRWQLIYSAQDWPLRNILSSLLGRREFDGKLQASGWAQQEPGQPWVGSSVLLVDDPVLEIRRNQFRTERVKLGSARLDLFATPTEFRSSIDVKATDSTQFAGEVLAERRGELAEHPLRGRIHGDSAVLGALPLFVPEIDRSSGELDAEVEIHGTLGAPQFDGRFSVRNGHFELYRTNLVLSDVTLDGRFVGDRLQIDGRGQTRKGALTLSGQFDWPEGGMNGELRLKGENLLVSDTPEYRVQASPDLRLKVADGEYDVDGEILIPTAKIAPKQLTTSVATSSDQRIVGAEAEALPEDAPQQQLRLRSRIEVKLGEDVRVETFGLRARLAGAVTVVTRPGDEVRGTGEITVVEGEYKAFGQDVKITRGRLGFRNSPLGDPSLEIAAERVIEAEDVTVTVNIRGTLRQPFLTLSSTPAMSQSEALSWLLTGRSIDTLQSGEATSVNSAAESLAISGGGVLLGGVGRRLGLDEVSVERTGDDDTSVVLGKFLSPRLFVSYGISIAEAINTVKLRYTLNERWSLRAEAGVEQSADVEFRIER